MKTEIKSAAYWQALVEKRDQEIASLNQQIAWLTEQLRLARGRRFAASSEKSEHLFEQISLFNKSETAVDMDDPETVWENVSYQRRKSRGKREIDLSRLPAEQVIHELPEKERICPQCGKPLHQCGHEVLRRELVYIPAQYKVREHIQTVYSCRHCERTSDCVPIKKGEVPPPLIPGSGIASPSLLAHILHCKYNLALPLYRQEREFGRIGVPISRQTMSNWIIYVYEHYFVEFIKALRCELIKNDILHADETTLTVLQEPGRKAQNKSYIWVYRTSGNAKRPIVLYDYRSSRAGECASDFLEGFSGFLHTDGYEAYHCKLPDSIISVGCWAHMRRKFCDALKVLPKEIRQRSPAQKGLAYCNKLFELEEEYAKQGLSFEQRQQARLEKSKPEADRFFAWAKQEQMDHPVTKSTLATALTYAVNQQNWLMNVFLDGRLELSNNRVERSVRPFAIGRKNWLFCNTPTGAVASAAMYSIVETSKANHLDPFLYFHFLLKHLSLGYSISDCLPWSEFSRQFCG